MKENQTLGYTPEQIQEQIIEAISENQHLKAHTASLVRNLYKEIDNSKVVISHRFSDAPFGQLQEIYDRLRDVVDDYAGEVATVSVVGVLAMLQQHIINEAGDEE